MFTWDEWTFGSNATSSLVSLLHSLVHFYFKGCMVSLSLSPISSATTHLPLVYCFQWQMQLNSCTVAGGCRCTSDKEAFLYIRLRRQVTKDSTQQLGHHACFTCEVNGFVQIPYMRAVHMLHAHLPIAF